MKRENGITLIALVITIIVLIILAAVTISGIVKRNNVIDNARAAREETARQREEEEKLADGQLYLDDVEYSSIDDLIANSGDTYSRPHPSQQNTTDIGIGTDGQLVNLDLWNYEHQRRWLDIIRERKRNSWISKFTINSGWTNSRNNSTIY